MDSQLTTSSSYAAPLARKQASDLIQDKPQKKYTRAMPPPAVSMPPPQDDFTDVEDDFPTPRANPNYSSSASQAMAASSSSYTQDRRESTESSSTYFEDDLYDSPSDDDSEVVPIKVSDSIRKTIANSSQTRQYVRVPSLIIPSPGLWPTVQKAAGTGDPPLLSPQLPLSPAALARLVASSSLRVPSQSTTPSLDGSLTSEEVSNNSSPSTPDIRSTGAAEGEWDPPVQLHPDAMDTLLQISYVCPQIDPQDLEASVVAVPEIIPRQMVERGLNIKITIPQAPRAPSTAGEDEFSPLSIPSPGGFFASLVGGASNVWSLGRPRSEPSTSIAETFYDVPWKREPARILERVVEVEETSSEGPSTARRVTSPSPDSATLGHLDIAEAFDNEQLEQQDYDEEYEQKLKQTASTHMSRTSVWLRALDTYISFPDSTLVPDKDSPAPETPKTPVSSTKSQSPESVSGISPAKKSVRFADDPAQSPISIRDPRPITSDSLFYRAFQHFNNKGNARDAYTHREARADSIRAQRLYLPQVHRARLMGSFATVVHSAPRKDSAAIRAVVNDEESAKERELVAAAGKEQQALEQVSLPCFDLGADRFLGGGTLLPRATIDMMTRKVQSGHGIRILDLGGQPTASWGWSVATERREAKVYTAVPATMGSNVNWTAHRGPSNHRTVVVPNLWTLPFQSASFDIVSARTLHTLLRNTLPTRDGGDEWDATLGELHRILAPGGYLHFTLLDAELTGPLSNPLARKGIEFAVNLGTRGYDPCAGRRFASRLEKAEFSEVRRSWMSLPLGVSNSEGVGAVTGLYGGLAWERWMLKFQKETGRREEQLLEGVAKAMEEATALQDGTAWRMLVGCARKPG